tara:strand:+ start:2351 stop:2854 length:504 start_codon:yes stop_codon:yes gene_type:complete
MSGIILILILAVWFYVVLKLTGFCVSKMKSGTKRSFFRFFLGIIFFLAPVADDIAGGFQFRALCRSDGMLIFDEGKLRQMTLVSGARKRMKVDNTILPINEHITNWVDVKTKETLLVQKDYNVKGGWLSRSIGFPEGSPPLTFNGQCRSHKKLRQVQEKLNFKIIYR